MKVFRSTIIKMETEKLKGSWKKSVWQEKCPRCLEGDLWTTQNIYTKGFSKMHETCSHCGLKYEMEQGFWYGAMYISYAMGVAITVSVVVALTVLTDLGIWEKSGFATLALLLCMPPMFRYSRNLWINLFIHHDPKNKKS